MYVVSNLINYEHMNIKIINFQDIQIVEYFIWKYIKHLEFICRYMLMGNNV